MVAIVVAIPVHHLFGLNASIVRYMGITLLAIGLRPAEKLYEELLIGSKVSRADHPRIMRAKEDFLPIDVFDPVLEQLRAASDRIDHKVARQILHKTVKEHVPNGNIDDLIWAQKTGTAGDAATPTVVDFPIRDS